MFKELDRLVMFHCTKPHPIIASYSLGNLTIEKQMTS